jgi:hypothetical protein
MIISHQHKFIFIKTHKTAGSSMEMALAPLCGPHDVITPMESNAQSEIPRNFHEDHILGRLYSRSRLARKCIDRHSPLLGAWYYEHMPATRVRELIGEEVWNSYHKFCIERNPWDKVVSYYNWKKFGQNKPMPAFKTWVMQKTHRLPLDARLYFDGNACMMDEVLEYQGLRWQHAPRKNQHYEPTCRLPRLLRRGNSGKSRSRVFPRNSFDGIYL